MVYWSKCVYKRPERVLKEAAMSEEFSLTDWLSEGAKGIRSALHRPKRGILPENFRQHIKSSRKEFLLAFRSLFDTAIDRVDKPEGTAPRKATKIKAD